MNALSLPSIVSRIVLTGLMASAFILKNRWAFLLACLLSVFLGAKVVKNSRTTRNRKVLDPNEYQEFPLQAKTVLSHNTSIYRFKLPRPTDILGLPTGQHISLCATVKDQSRDVVRSYTPISSNHEAGYFDLLVKSYPTGSMSKHLEDMQLGQSIKIRGPKGAMTYTPNMCRHIGMIAGGTGITPMYQVIKEVIRNRPLEGGHDITILDLIFANVDEKDILLRKELDELASEDDRFRVHYTLNKPPPRWDGSTGFVTPDMIKKHLPAPATDVKILLCGPPPMIAAMKVALESLGYTKARPVSKLADQVFCF